MHVVFQNFGLWYSCRSLCNLDVPDIIKTRKFASNSHRHHSFSNNFIMSTLLDIGCYSYPVYLKRISEGEGSHILDCIAQALN
jgi:hypothetical protein